MPSPGRKPKLAKLEEQQAALAAKIKAEKRAERKRQLEVERQQYLVLGRALAKELAENEELSTALEPILNARVTKPSERKLLGLEPLK